MIGCNEVIVKERAQLIQDVNNQRNKIAQWQNYLNTTPAPQPTLQTFQEYDEQLPKMAFIGKAEGAFNLIYESKPSLLFLVLCLYTPVDQQENFLNINTIQGLQNFQQQLQQRHLMTGPPPEIPQINWEQYKITFSSIFVGAIERVLDPSLIKTSIRKLEQQLQEVHQQLQKIQQQLQGIHQAFYGSHPHTMLRESKATMCSPSADIKFWESLPYHGTAGSLGIINWDKALIAAQHRNYMPFIDIYSQMQPQTWRNFFVNYFKWGQKMHMKAHTTHHQKWNS